ncbi:MAG: hypothetical protein Q9204_004266 [Flavoplaca sp. TL-2023a]
MTMTSSMQPLVRIIILFNFFAIYECLSPASAASALNKPLRVSQPHCWDDPSKFAPLIFKDCIDVINIEITKTHDPTIPLKFSRDARLHPDIQLPKFWTHGESKCGVGVDFEPGLQGYDRTTLQDVKMAARRVAVECIIGEPHLGGFAQLGWYGRLGVLITGASPRLSTEVENGTVEVN